MSETVGRRQRRARAESRGGCLRQLIVGELRSYSPAYESMAMLDTVATALIAGATNSGRAYTGAKVLSLTALDHASYPAESGLCTMLCVVLWCGPPVVSWVATDLDLDAARAPGAHKIAEGALPESLALEFHRAGLLRAPSVCFEPSRPMLPPTRFVLAAIRPALQACVNVAPDGSVSRRCPRTPGACVACDRVWRTALHLVEPPTSPSSSATRAATVSARPIVRALASVIAQATTSSPRQASFAPAHQASSTQTPALPAHDAQQRQRRQQQQGPPLADQRAKRQRREHKECVPIATEHPLPTRPTQATTPASVGVVAAAPVVHPRCACAACSAASRFCVGKIVRVECTAGCRTPFHRTCWRAMAVVPDETRACATPDCWGLWARVTSARRASDGSESTPYIEWSRPQRRPTASVATATTKDGAKSTTTRRRMGRAGASAMGPPAPMPPAKGEDQTRMPCKQKTADTDHNDNTLDGDQEDGNEGAYVGRVRRRRPRQQLRGPPHKRIDPLKVVARPAIATADTDRSDERAVAEQHATRLKRQQTDALVRNAIAATTTTKPLDGSGRKRSRRSRTAKKEAVQTTTPASDDAVPSSDAPSRGPQDVYGVWAAFFEWDHVPLSLLPEAPAAPPSVGRMWTLPPLLREDVPRASAVWACLCTSVPLA
ncbi:hypothetical protein pqer_cds_1145 [Pandoravirus quercus]|uniref:Uncharacterized protein n=1 Tax=Pandoravirus quercus TaxID=2107709 RepID=A0A2U7UAU2_9VIRU|nr:hypothetical protein pqer_cds_1145 [Pandoravirus quercus]AVK75567.1 hypothetical protein pqer_cds_1145 [Pandoravirus quercus]